MNFLLGNHPFKRISHVFSSRIPHVYPFPEGAVKNHIGLRNYQYSLITCVSEMMSPILLDSDISGSAFHLNVSLEITSILDVIKHWILNAVYADDHLFQLLNNFDLNINNYSVTELEELLTLGKVYNEDEIMNKKDDICIKIVNDNTLSFEMKSKMEKFFDNVSTILKNIKCNNDDNKNNDVTNNGDKMKNNNVDTDSSGIERVDSILDLKTPMMKNTNNLKE